MARKCKISFSKYQWYNHLSDLRSNTATATEMDWVPCRQLQQIYSEVDRPRRPSWYCSLNNTGGKFFRDITKIQLRSTLNLFCESHKYGSNFLSIQILTFIMLSPNYIKYNLSYPLWQMVLVTLYVVRWVGIILTFPKRYNTCTTNKNFEMTLLTLFMGVDGCGR